MLLDFGPQTAYSLPRQQNRERVGEATSQVEVLPPHLEARDEHGETSMSLSESGTTGRNVTQTAELQMGLLLQDPESMSQQDDMAATVINAGADGANSKVSFGCPFIIEVLINAEDLTGATTDQLSALTGSPLDVFPVWDSTAAAGTTGCPFKIKILDFHVVTLTENVQTATDTILIQKVDSDLTTQTDISNALDVNVADSILVRATTMDQDACVIDVKENIRFDIVLGSASDDRAYKAVLTCMRCVADV